MTTYVDDRIGVRAESVGGHGVELVCDCPFCGARRKLYVNQRLGRYICYRCDERGDTVRLVEQVDGVPRRDALRFVLEGAVRLPSRSVEDLLADAPEASTTAVEKTGDLELPQTFVPVFDGSTWTIPSYLRERRIQARVAAAYGVGSCDRGCGTDCRSRAPERRPCDACRYAGRIILPAHVGGRLAFFQARSMVGAMPKYLAPAVDRSGALWGYDEALGAPRVLVVEGPFDVLGCAQAGLAAVGLMGKVCSTRQAALLASGGFARATVMLDPEATREGASVAMFLGSLMDTDMAVLPDGLDPGDAPREALRAAVDAARAPGLRERFLRPYAKSSCV